MASTIATKLKQQIVPNWTAIFSWACNTGHIEAMRMVKEVQGDLIASILDDNSALMEYLFDSVKNNQPAILEEFLKYGAKPDTFRMGLTLLGEACKRDNLKCVEILLNHKADVTLADDFPFFNFPKSPLVIAASLNHLAIVEYLMDNTVAGSHVGSEALYEAGKNGYTRAIDIILGHKNLVVGFDILEKALQKAVTNNNVNVVEILIEKGAHVNTSCIFVHLLW